MNKQIWKMRDNLNKCIVANEAAQVPKKECFHVPKTECSNVPIKAPVSVPLKKCWEVRTTNDNSIYDCPVICARFRENIASQCQ